MPALPVYVSQALMMSKATIATGSIGGSHDAASCSVQSGLQDGSLLMSLGSLHASRLLVHGDIISVGHDDTMLLDDGGGQLMKISYSSIRDPHPRRTPSSAALDAIKVSDLLKCMHSFRLVTLCCVLCHWTVRDSLCWRRK